MTLSSNDIFTQKRFHPKKSRVGAIKKVRVCVKASPAEGRRRLHTNTAYARLSSVEGRKAGGLGFRSLGFRGFGGQGVWVFRCLGVQVFGCLGVQVFGCSGVWVFRCLGVQGSVFWVWDESGFG